MSIRLAVIGTGGMANNHAKAFQAMAGVELVAAVDTDPNRAKDFADTYDIKHTFASVDELIAFGEFDAATNVTPDAVHTRTTLPVLAAGKHMLCEKPLATSYEDAKAMADAAERAGVVNMVNLTYRNSPALQKAAQMVADGQLGNVRHFEASYLQSWLTQPAWGDWKTESQWLWRLSTQHGSKGVLGDVGIHIIDFASFAIGALPASVSADLITFDKAPNNQIGEYPLDANDSCTLQLRLANGAAGVVHATRFASGHFNDLFLRVYGDQGGLELRYINHVDTLSISIGEDMKTATWREVDLNEVDTVYQRFISAIQNGGAYEPNFARGAALQQVLDAAERSAEQDSQRLALN